MGKPGEIGDWSPFRAYLPPRRGPAAADILALAFLGAAGTAVFTRAVALPQYQWQWSLLGEFLLRRGEMGEWEPGLLLTGLFTTLRAGFWTLVFSLPLGVAVGCLGSGRGLPARLFCQIYVNLARNTPPLVLLFCVYFFAGNLLPLEAIQEALRQMSPWLKDIFSAIFAPLGQVDRMLAAVLALGLYQGAYVAEIARSGLESVPRGQRDAALALGFSPLAALRLVVLPQAARLILPPLTGQAITTFKDTALISLISLPDLVFQSLEIMAVSSMTFEIWIASALIYLLLGGFCAILGALAERKFAFMAR